MRGISRNPSKAQPWTAKGVEVVKGDLNDKESLIAAFQGANAIFSSTDFWAQFFIPATQEELKPGQSLNQYCYDLEVQQGKNVADAAATVEGLDRFIISSLCNVKKLSKGKFTWVYHFDSKAKTVEYVREMQPELAAKMSVVQMGAYMSNWTFMVKPAKVGALTQCSTSQVLTSSSKPMARIGFPMSARGKRQFHTSTP